MSRKGSYGPDSLHAVVAAPRGDLGAMAACSGLLSRSPDALHVGHQILSNEGNSRAPETWNANQDARSRLVSAKGALGLPCSLTAPPTFRGFRRRRPVRGPRKKAALCGALLCTARIHVSLLFAGEADVSPNNGSRSQGTAVTDSKCTVGPKNAWPDANPADPGGRPHLVRLFSRDAPGREDNTFKDRPSESDELQTIQEDSAAPAEGLDAMASQKRPSQRHGSKYLASASAVDHARHGFLPRHRDTGILDSLGRFFGGDRGSPKRGSGKVSSEE